MRERKSHRNNDFIIGTLNMENNIFPPVQNHNVGYEVGCAFLVYPINLKTGEVNYLDLQSAVKLKVSGNIEKAICTYSAGSGFDWGNISQHPEDKVQAILDKKWDAMLCLLVYNHRLELQLDTSEMYLLIQRYGRIILTTESLMKENIGYVTKTIHVDRPFPRDRPDLVHSTDLFVDHAEFNILVHELAETNAQGDQIGKHILATFEPLEHADHSTQSFDFLSAHAQRDQAKSPFDYSFHYDFFHQDWDVVKGVSSNGTLPNGNILSFERTDSF